MERKTRLLAVAVGTGRIGYVFLIGGKVRDWKLSKRAAMSVELARAYAETCMHTLRPDVVVTEDVPRRSLKSRRTRDMIAAVSGAAVERQILEIKVLRASAFANKYEEADALGKRFPEIAAWVPKKPRLWQPEPRNTVYFAALALAVNVIGSPK